ncbi:tail fiber protein [Niabella terrae]
METLIGMIAMFGFNFIPQGWVYCDGRLLPIAQYETLFSLIGTTYGGDGITTFAVPDLRGRIAIGQGTGPGQPNYVVGQAGGAETSTLTINNLPNHNHTIFGTSEQGDTNAPAGAYPANSLQIDKEYKTAPTEKVLMNSGVVGNGGTSPQPFSVLQPLLTINYCISLFGIYPSRN